MALIDNVDLSRLSRKCRELQRWEFLLTANPLLLEGVTGSPIDPLAVLRGEVIPEYAGWGGPVE